VSEGNREFIFPNDNGQACAVAIAGLFGDRERGDTPKSENRGRSVRVFSQEQMFTFYYEVSVAGRVP
jgi:hypothetical protein